MRALATVSAREVPCDPLGDLVRVRVRVWVRVRVRVRARVRARVSVRVSDPLGDLGGRTEASTCAFIRAVSAAYTPSRVGPGLGPRTRAPVSAAYTRRLVKRGKAVGLG